MIPTLKTRNEDVLGCKSFDNFSLLYWILPSLAVLAMASVALVAEGAEIRSCNLGKSEASTRLLVAILGEECYQAGRGQLLLVPPLPHISRGELGGIPPSRAPCKHLLLGGIVTLAPYFPSTSRASYLLLGRFRGEHG